MADTKLAPLFTDAAFIYQGDAAGAAGVAFWTPAGGSPGPSSTPTGGKGLKPKGTARALYENEQVVIKAVYLSTLTATATLAIFSGATPIFNVNCAAGDTVEVGPIAVKASRGTIPTIQIAGTSAALEVKVEYEIKTLNDSPKPASGNTDVTI